MYLLDTDWIIRALASHELATRTLCNLANSRIHESIISVGQLYDGAFMSVHPQAHLLSFRQFLDSCRVLNLNDPIMERFAEIRSFLRRGGQLIPDFDILIAATAMHHNLTLLTFNLRDFTRIPDLMLFKTR